MGWPRVVPGRLSRQDGSKVSDDVHERVHRVMSAFDDELDLGLTNEERGEVIQGVVMTIAYLVAAASGGEPDLFVDLFRESWQLGLENPVRKHPREREN